MEIELTGFVLAFHFKSKRSSEFDLYLK